MRDEFDRIATTTSFAGKNLLNGGFTAQTFQVGDDVGETIAVSISSARSTDIGTTFTAAQATLLDAFQGTTTAGASNSVAAQTLSFTVGGERTDVSIALAASAQSLASSISSEVAGVTATASNTASITMGETHTYTALIGSTSTSSHASDTYSVTVDGAVVLSATAIDVTGQGSSALTASTVVTSLTNHASYAASDLEITSSSGVMSITDKMGGVVDLVFVSGGSGSGGSASLKQFTDNGFLAGGTADQFTVGGTTVTVNNSGASSADDMASNLQAQLAANTAISAEITAANTASTAVVTLTNSTGADLVVQDNASNNAGTRAFVSHDGTSTNNSEATATGVTVTGTLALTLTSDVAVDLFSDSTTITTGTAAADKSLTAGSHTQSTGNVSTLDVSTATGASSAIATIDSALEAISTQRASLGAVQSRFDSVVNNLMTMSENSSAAKSRIVDADFAAETAALSKSQILQQAGISVLAQANAQPQNVLALLQ